MTDHLTDRKDRHPAGEDPVTAPQPGHDETRPLTRQDAEAISIYDHIAWYGNVGARRNAYGNPTAHLEELARVAALVSTLNGWQAIGVHRAMLAGATLDQVALALGEPADAVIERWQAWSDGQRDLYETWRAEGKAAVLSYDQAEYDQVAAALFAEETKS